MPSSPDNDRALLEPIEAEFGKLTHEQQQAIHDLARHLERAITNTGVTLDGPAEHTRLLEAACLLIHRARAGGRKYASVTGSSGTPRELPFAYRVEDWRMRHIAVTDSLAAAVTAVQEAGLAPSQVDIYAVHDGNREARVPMDSYSRKTSPTREEAIAFIQRRQERARQAPAASRGLLRSFGFARCRPDDPLEKQIADYLESAPREWLPTLVIAVAEQVGDGFGEGPKLSL